MNRIKKTLIILSASFACFIPTKGYSNTKREPISNTMQHTREEAHQRKAMINVVTSYLLAVIIEDDTNSFSPVRSNFYRALLLELNVDGTPENFKNDFQEFAYQLSQKPREAKKITFTFASQLKRDHEIDLFHIVTEIGKRTEDYPIDADMPQRNDEENFDYIKTLDITRREVVHAIIKGPTKSQLADIRKFTATLPALSSEKQISMMEAYSIIELEKLVKQGDEQALIELADRHYLGTGIEKNLTKSISLLNQGAQQGDALAQQRLAFCCIQGIGVAKDEKKAFFWIAKAAEQGVALAQADLSFLYLKGIGTIKDEQKAFFWAKKATQCVDGKAQIILSEFYRDGIGTTKDDQKVFFYTQKAAEQGIMHAQSYLAYLYREGIGTSKDGKKAFFWTKQAAYQGNLLALNNLSLHYFHGLGTTKNEEQAFYHIIKAAEQGYAPAQASLSYYYLKGIGREKDKEQAFFWKEKAAKQGYAQGEEKLKFLKPKPKSSR